MSASPDWPGPANTALASPTRRRDRLPMLGLGMSAGLWTCAIAVGAFMLTVPVYLVVRALESDAAASLAEPGVARIVLRSAALACVVTAGATALALPIAWLTARTDLPGRRFWAVATAIPLVVPSYVGAYLFRVAFGPRGLANAAWPGPGPGPLPSLDGFAGAALVLSLYTYPYSLLIVRAALTRLDPALEDASRTLGHSAAATFRRITLPQLRPALAAGGLLVALYALRDFGAVSIMRFDSFTRVIYTQYRSFDRASAAALSLVLVALAAALVALETRTEGRVAARLATARAHRRRNVIALGRWRWPALTFCATVLTLALVLPGGVLVYWLWRGPAPAGGSELWADAFRSALASGLGAVVTLAAAAPIAWLSVRRPGPASRSVERLSYIGFALPGVVVALALVAVGSRAVPMLYQTLPMLVAAYVVLFLPQAVGAVRASLLQVHPSLEESGRSLGRRPARVLASVTLPLASPGLAAGLALVFLTAMKELPATLLLSPYGYGTLATSIWSSASEAYFAQAAQPALLLILLSSIPTVWLLARVPEDIR